MPCTRRILSRWAAALAAACAAFSAADAQTLVSIKALAANMRTAPGKGSEVLWQLDRGYPLEVLERSGNWIQVRDFEGEQGWVAASTTGPARHHVVRVRNAKLRAGPGDGYVMVGSAVYGQVLATEFRGEDWVRVRLAPGRQAWIARDLVWGW
ncbi:MAG: hypothetical protein RJA36_338 [Pseudomonadota bacterium]